MKTLLGFALLGLAVAGGPALAAEGKFPDKTIRWVVPYPAGGGSDFLARTIGQTLATQTGQTVLVDNKPGGNTAIAAAEVARSAPDGYTVMSADNGTMVFNPALYNKLTYDVKELAPVTLMGQFPMILVLGPATQAQDAKAFLEEAKASADGLSYGSAGAGSPHHLAMEMLKRQAGLKMNHVPYRGAAPALTDVAGGQVPAMMVDLAAGAGFIHGGKVRPVAVAHASRLPQLPDVPTFAELGLPGMEAAAQVGMVVPAATPAVTIEQLNRVVLAAINDPAVHARLVEFGIQPVGNSPAEYQALLESETARWHSLIREAGITLD